MECDRYRQCDILHDHIYFRVPNPSNASYLNTAAAPYAERYLGLLKEQHGQRSYFEADLTRYTKNLHKKHIYLVHGTLDEEVNVAHSFLVAKSMIKNKFSFHQQVGL